jgi:hypothetical protein
MLAFNFGHPGYTLDNEEEEEEITGSIGNPREDKVYGIKEGVGEKTAGNA